MSAYKSSKKKSILQKGNEIQRCNDLRVRIKTWCKQEGLTQPMFADALNVSTKEMSNFMTGASLTGSNVYPKAMAYLKTRMPLSNCSYSDRESMTNNKWKITFK